MAGFVKKCPCLRPPIDDDVRELDYRHCSLADVPSEVFNFERTLEELYVDSNQIRDLPRELFYCHGIRKLSISDNEITSIPPAIASLINLEEFDLSKNGVIDMPENIKCCKYLRVVDASVNPLGKLPEGFTQLLNLTQLYLNDTFLDYLPGNFGRLSKLKILEIRENHLKTLPKSFSRLTELERLDIGHNEFGELPDVIGNLSSLLELWCDHNQITKITPTIGNLKQLMFLDASKNRLQSLPSEIEDCSSLADLHLTTNHIQALPESLGNLSNLTTLKVDDNQLTCLPTSIGGLSSLSELNVSVNELEDLPASLGLLRNLRTFYVDDNYLTFIPAELGSCNGITVLSLRNNKLEYVPDELGRIPRLRVLNLSNNRLKFLPFTIMKLKELQALWLSENQTRPLVPLQSDHDPDTGRKILTCYLLPQTEPDAGGDLDNYGDGDSFHASMWDEERTRRQQIKFDFDESLDDEGTLVRRPTPYPKEMREKMRHAQNLAMRQMIEGNGDVRWTSGKENGGFEGENTQDMVHHGSSSDIHMREARIIKPSSPSLQETHRLYRYDKEKFAKDKARMQHHRLSGSGLEDNVDASSHVSKSSHRKEKSGRSSRETSPVHSEKRSESPKKGKDKTPKKHKEDADDGGFSEVGNRSVSHHGTSTNPQTQSVGVSASSEKKDRPHRNSGGFAYCSPNELAKSFSQYGVSEQNVNANFQKPSPYSAPHNHRHRKMRNYDSDTGYRSESEIQFYRQQHLNNISVKPHSRAGYGRGYDSESERFIPSKREKRRDIGYSSDVEGYTGRHHQNTGYRPVVPLQSQYNASNSLPYDIHQTPENRRIRIKNDELYEQQMKNRDLNKSADRSFAPPSPGMFHRSKIIDQSTPVSPSPPNGVGFAVGSSDKSKVDGTLLNSSENLDRNSNNYLEQNMQINSGDITQRTEHQNQTNQPGSERTIPPPYKPAPPYMQSPGQRKLPPTPNRNSPYGVMNYDRRLSNSPIAARMSEMTIDEQKETTIDSDRYTQQISQQINDYVYSQVQLSRTPVSHKSPNLHRTPENSRAPLAYVSENSRTPVSHMHDPLRTPVKQMIPENSRTPVSNNLDNSRIPLLQGDNSRTPVSHAYDNSQMHNMSPYSDYSRTQLSHMTPDRSRTPASINGGDDRRDSPRESGYSSREHSSNSNRNSPFDGPTRHFNDQGSHGSGSFEPEDVQNPTMSTYEDIAMFKNNSDPLSQVSSSTDSGYGHGHNPYDRGDLSKYSVYSSQQMSRPPPSPSQNFQPHFQTPIRGDNPMANRSREATPDHLHDRSQYSQNRNYQNMSPANEKFHVTITKNPGMGFSIAGGIGSYGNPYRPDDQGIFVTKVNPEGPAATSLRPGDKILEVNGQDFNNIHHDKAVSSLKTTTKTVSLYIERI